MVTEIQIGKSRAHLGYLRVVLDLLGSKAGMTKRDLDAAQHAVSEVCSNSLNGSGEPESARLSLRLAAEDSLLSMEIRDNGADEADACAPNSRYAALVEQLRRSVDKAELVRGDNGLTICLEKRAHSSESPAVGTPCQLAAAGSSSLQV